MLEDLQLGHNSLKSLGSADGDGNGSSSLYPLRSLKCLNLTHNELREFSLASLRGLRELRLLDLSSNRIAKLHRERPSSEVGACFIVPAFSRHIDISTISLTGVDRLRPICNLYRI